MNGQANKPINRRFFLRLATALGALSAPLRAVAESLALPSRSGIASWFSGKKKSKKLVILGIDGMDPNLLQKFVSEGIMPHFQALIAEGSFSPLQTSVSPQSPIAWSTFITGMDSGGHGIYDFVHRDPTTYGMYKSMSRVTGAEWNLSLGSWVVPLSGAKAESLRQGKAFWQIMGERGIPSIVYRMPVNFPPVEAEASVALSGMGTPDIKGESGIFSYYTDRLPANAGEFTGGEAYKVIIRNGRIDTQIHGPKNPFRRTPKKQLYHRQSEQGEVDYENPDCTVDLTIFLDRKAKAAKFVVGDKEFILKEGEWSDWVRIDFEAAPWSTISSIGRFYLKELDPRFQLYLSPLQINPEEPAVPISYPTDWSKKLCSCIGYFYTQELPEDTKALTYDVFSGKDFWDQTVFIYDESLRAMATLLEHHQEGLLFFYFSTLDQGSHMLWRYMDADHPGHIHDEFLVNGIRELYIKMDTALGEARARMDAETPLIVMSDHGFSPFYWGVNLNTWLLQQGYVVLKDPNSTLHEREKNFLNVDWSKTRAYAVGLNGLYINLKGREKEGCVEPEVYEALLAELKAGLLAMEDPKTGGHPVSQVVIPPHEFHGPLKADGPDIIVGYNWGYRVSWTSPLGQFPPVLIGENHDAWSGDHCIDNRHVPGILVTNQKIIMEHPALYDLTIAVLDQFGIPPQPGMIGKNCLEKTG